MDRVHKALGLTTYVGSALIVISLLFLIRDIRSESFVVHAGAAVTMPGIFFAFSILTRKLANAPLASAGFVTASAWLVGVALIHLNEWRWLLPPSLVASYWLVASGLAAVMVTALASRTHLFFMVPIVALLQLNFAWSAISAVGVPLLWQPFLITGVAVIWIFVRVRDEFWQRAYRISAVLLLIFLCGFLLWLPEKLPAAVVLTWLVAAGLMGVLGARLHVGLAYHIAAWGFAGAWALAHHTWVGDPATFGLWMMFPAALALLFGRLTRIGRKRTKPDGFIAAMYRWTAADLAIGLSGISMISVAVSLSSVDHFTLLQTLLALAALWLGLGLEYRLAIFVHLALYAAPFPITMLLVSSSIAFIHLPTLGMAWQFGGVILLLIGHGLAQGRISVRTPFFITGYALVGAGVLMADHVTMPLNLGVATFTTLFTAIAILFDWHPVWDSFVEWIAPSSVRPYAHRAIRSGFLLLGAWFAAVWLQILLGSLGLSAERQGLGLVLISSGWFLVGWMLDRLPTVMGWYVHSAGWLLWGIGLLQVFFSPTEAVIAAVFGLGISAEQLFRGRRGYWLPIALLQIAFVLMQAARLLTLPTGTLLGILATSIVVISLARPQKLPVRGLVVVGIFILGLAVHFFGPSGNLRYLSHIVEVLLLAAGFIVVVFREPLWRLGSVIVIWVGWWVLLQSLGVEGVIQQNAPVAIILLGITRSNPKSASLIEVLGLGLIIYTAIISTLISPETGYLEGRLDTTGLIIGGLSALGLIIYGVVCQRRRSFAVGVVGIIGGLLLLALRISPWLIPLSGGALLILFSLLVELYRDSAEARLNSLVNIWRSWQ